MLPIFVCIAGIFLGLYVNVLVLLLVCLIGSAVLLIVNLASGLSFYVGLGDLLIPLILGQAGYMLGLTGRDTYGHFLARFHAAQSNRI